MNSADNAVTVIDYFHPIPRNTKDMVVMLVTPKQKVISKIILLNVDQHGVHEVKLKPSIKPQSSDGNGNRHYYGMDDN